MVFFVQEAKKKKRTKFKPYTGRLKSASVGKMTQSLEETEMNMIAHEIKATFQGTSLFYKFSGQTNLGILKNLN
jgi:hypothetical protein